MAGGSCQQGAEGAFFLQKGAGPLLLKNQVAFQQQKALLQLAGQQAQAVHRPRPLVTGIFQKGHILAAGKMPAELLKLETANDVKTLDSAVFQDLEGAIQDRPLTQGQQSGRDVECLPAPSGQNHGRPDRRGFFGERELHLLAVQKGALQQPAAPVCQGEPGAFPLPAGKEVFLLFSVAEKAVDFSHRNIQNRGQLPLIGGWGLIDSAQNRKQVIH